MAAEPFTDQAKNNGQTKDVSAAPDTDRASPAPDTGPASAAPDAEQADSTVGSLDSLLAGGTAGPVSRFRPDASLARWALRLASQPGDGGPPGRQTERGHGPASPSAARRLPRRAGIAGSPTPAWTGNPLLKRTLQMYLALGWNRSGSARRRRPGLAGQRRACSSC